jgi:alkylhydroperoxidase/carboxymuconolactone decarboxylase family protein YurZ
VFAQGDLGLPIFEVDGVRVGVLICYDLRFPEAMRVLALRDAQIVAVPAAWVGDFDLAHPREGQPIGQVAAATVQANLNQVFVVAADRVGTDGDVTMLGSSTIASPYGEYLTGPLDRDTERVVVTEVDLDDQLASRARGDGIRPREDRRPDVYGDLLGYREQDATRLLSDVEGKRGYLLNMHRILAESDPEFLHAYEGLMTAAYTRDRLIDRRTAEFIYVAVLTALGSSEEHLIAHMQAAITAGATSLELLQVLEQTLPPAGVPRFMAALDAWEAVCGQASDRSQPEKARLA